MGMGRILVYNQAIATRNGGGLQKDLLDHCEVGTIHEQSKKYIGSG